MRFSAGDPRQFVQVAIPRYAAVALSSSVDASHEGWLAACTFSGERMLKMTPRIGRLSGLIAAGVAIVGTGSV